MSICAEEGFKNYKKYLLGELRSMIVDTMSYDFLGKGRFILSEVVSILEAQIKETKRSKAMPYQFDDFINHLWTRIGEVEYSITVIRKALESEGFVGLDRDKLAHDIEILHDEAQSLFELTEEPWFWAGHGKKDNEGNYRNGAKEPDIKTTSGELKPKYVKIWLHDTERVRKNLRFYSDYFFGPYPFPQDVPLRVGSIKDLWVVERIDTEPWDITYFETFEDALEEAESILKHLRKRDDNIRELGEFREED